MFSFPAHAPTAVFTLSLHDALPISRPASGGHGRSLPRPSRAARPDPTELRGTLCPAGGPAVDLEAESCPGTPPRSEEHTSELQSHHDLVCRLLLEKKKKKRISTNIA